MRSLGVNFLLFRRRFGVNLNEKFLSFNFCGVNFLGFFGFLSEKFLFLKFYKMREFFGADFCKMREFFVKFLGVKFLQKTQKIQLKPSLRAKCGSTSVAIQKFTKKALKITCFKPCGSRNDDINLKATNLVNSLNFHKNLASNSNQNFKSKYQNLSHKFLYPNSFKRLVNA